MKKQDLLELIDKGLYESKTDLEKMRETLNNDWLFMDELSIRTSLGNIRMREGEIGAYERVRFYVDR
jgi:hypothetical protein